MFELHHLDALYYCKVQIMSIHKCNTSAPLTTYSGGKGGGGKFHCYYFLVIKQVIQKVYAAGIFLKCKLWMKCRFIIMFLCKTRFKLSFRRCLSDIKNISFIYKNKSTPYTIHDFSSFLSNFGFSLKENKNFDLCS